MKVEQVKPHFARVKEASRAQENPRVSYIVNRPFFKPDPQTKERPITELLPRFKGRDAAWWLEKMACESEKPVQVLDIGCGNGRAMKDVLERHRGKVQVRGLTKKLFTPTQVDPESIEVDDIGRLPNPFPRESVDFIYSYYCFYSSLRPVPQLLRKIYPILAPGGMAFLDFGQGAEAIIDDATLQLFPWLRRHRYEIEHKSCLVGDGSRDSLHIEGCSLRKPADRPKLHYPTRYYKDGFRLMNVFDEQKARIFEKRLRE
jgi:SAM-dependent methyltransferase